MADAAPTPPSSSSSSPRTAAAWDQLFVPIVAAMLFGNCAGACGRLESESYAIETVSEVVSRDGRVGVVVGCVAAVIVAHLLRRLWAPLRVATAVAAWLVSASVWGGEFQTSACISSPCDGSEKHYRSGWPFGLKTTFLAPLHDSDVPLPLPTMAPTTTATPTRPQPPPERLGVVRGPLTSFPHGAESDCSADVVDAAGVVWLVSGQDTCRWLANVDGTERCVDGDDDALRLTWLGERRDTSDAFHQRSERDGLLSAQAADGAAPVTFKVVGRDFCLK